MAGIVDPWILDSEGFSFGFAKAEGFWEENSKILQLIKQNKKVHPHCFTNLEKIRENST